MGPCLAWVMAGGWGYHCAPWLWWKTVARVRGWYLALTGYETHLILHLIVKLTMMMKTKTDEFHAQRIYDSMKWEKRK